LIVVGQQRQTRLAPLDLLAKPVNLVFLPDITDRRAGDQQHKNNAFSAGPNRIAAD
jgi:hypothetical protein